MESMMRDFDLNNMKRTPKGKLPAYTFPGAYPIVYVTPSNAHLCPDCATCALDDPYEYDAFKPVNYLIHMQGAPITCDECDRQIESAYGEDE